MKWAADGHRLPTATEWSAAAGKVADPQATDGTQPVGQGKPNANGLYDTAGNVRELVWTYGDVFDPEKHNAQTVMGGDFHGPGDALAADRAASPYGDVPFDGNHNIGLRLVCRNAGLAAPPTDSAPGGTEFEKGQKTQARKTAEPAPSVAAKSEILYFGSQSGDFFAVDAKTAKEVWRTELGGAIETSPWPGDGVVYVSCDDGFLYALEGR